MICSPCKSQNHDSCVDLHLLGTGRNGCACQHRSGGFTTSTLNPDGSKTHGVYGATGKRGSALKTDPWKSMIATAVSERKASEGQE